MTDIRKIRPTGETIEIGGHQLLWAQDISHATILRHALINDRDEVISNHPLREDVILGARYHLLSKLATEMSFDDFRSVVLVIPVVPGRDGERGESSRRFLVDEGLFCTREYGNGVFRLMKEALRAYDLKPDGDRPIDRDNFAGKFVATVLGACTDPSGTAIHLFVGSDTRPIVLVNMHSQAANLTMDSIIKAAYDIFLADKDDASHSHAKPRFTC